MSPRTIRWVVQIVFVIGIAGMIVGSIQDNNGIAVTFGVITAVGALGLILVTSVSEAGAFDRAARFDERTAEQLERQITELAAKGADEEEVRGLVRTAVRLGASVARPSREG